MPADGTVTLEHAASSVRRQRRIRPATLAVLGAYAIAGSALVGTRLVGLDRSLWQDEIRTVTDFVRQGPREILVATYVPNNHELHSLLLWATSSLLGESEVAFRLWSAVPFILGAAVVAVWLHVRVGSAPALVFLFLATCSPLLLDLSRQARGYGLAFLTMSVLVVSALELDRAPRTAALVAFCAAGVAGTLTLPIFGVAFAVTSLALSTRREVRPRLVWPVSACWLAIAAWYAPHVDDLFANTQQPFGARIAWWALPTSPLDMVLVPALLWIEGPFLTSSAVRLPLVALVVAALLFVGDRRLVVVLGPSVAATMLVVWAGRMYFTPRFASYLLVPLFLALAVAVCRLLRPSGRVTTLGRAAVGLTVLALVAAGFVSEAPDVLRLPREAHRDAAELIHARVPESTPVLAYTYHPSDLAFYVRNAVYGLRHNEVPERVCNARRTIVYVTQPLGTRPVDVPCLERPDVTHVRLRQYSRGERIDVWIVPRA